ncbi:MAG TPA: response regulator transcription factor [Nitrospiraceae bacterium]|nr:response regulator transcription factor [Nitrospiraceae bacterium]
MPITLVIAEDQRLFRQSLRLLLEHERDLEVVGEAIDGREAVEFSLKLKPDIILMDVDMPRLDGVTATRLIRGCMPVVRVLMLSMHDEDARIVAAVQAGACGYVLKDADHQEFLRIIRATYRGEQVCSPFMPDRFAKRVVSAMKAAEGVIDGGVTALTDREREILACAAAGCGNKEIADQLCVSPDTVKTHLHHIYQKLHVTGRVEAILAYLQSK